MTKWKILNSKVGAEDIVGTLLKNRNIKDRDGFLDPKYEDLLDPFKLSGMNEAVKKVSNAIEGNEPIGVFSDYDADGIPAAVLAKGGLEFIAQTKDSKTKIEVYIPGRDEGYGLSKKGIDLLASKGCRLIIACDMGVTAKGEVEYARKIGLDLIIIDHHLPQADKLPVATIIDPNQETDRYPFKFRCACGLVHSFISACFEKILDEKWQEKGKNWLKWALDLVAISTIADMVPLIDENRTLAKYGLKVLSKTKRKGLLALYKEARIDADNISPYTVGFQIAPRLNAPGRIKHASLAYSLLTAETAPKAKDRAEQIEKINKKRQEDLEKTFLEAIETIERNELHKNKIIMVAKKDWTVGIVGLVAGRLMEKYSRPTIVLGEQDGVAKGSARSLEGIHILEVLGSVSDNLLSFGGHARAAGLSLKPKDFAKTYNQILTWAEANIDNAHLQPTLKIDMYLPIEKVTIKTAETIDRLEPFGLGNPRPVFAITGGKVTEKRELGKDKNHLKLIIGTSKMQCEAMAFGGVEKFADITAGSSVTIAGSLSIDEWQGNKKCKIHVSDIKISKT